MKVLNGLALGLLIVGGVNWGLVGLAKFDLVKLITTGNGTVPTGYSNVLGTIVYGLVAASALYACSFYARSNRELSV